jgi:hypothetical protein
VDTILPDSQNSRIKAIEWLSVARSNIAVLWSVTA